MTNRFQKPTGTLGGLPRFEFVCELKPEHIVRVQQTEGIRPAKDFALRLSAIIKDAADHILFPRLRPPADPFKRFAAAADKLAQEVSVEKHGFAAVVAARSAQREAHAAANALARRPGQPVNETRKKFFCEVLNLGADCGLDLRFQSSNKNDEGWIEKPTPMFIFLKAAIGVVVETVEEAARVAGAAAGNDLERRLADWRIADATLLNHLRKAASSLVSTTASTEKSPT